MEDLTKNEQPQPVQQDWLELAIHELGTVGIVHEKYQTYMSYIYRAFRIQDRMYDKVRRHKLTIKELLREGFPCQVIADYYEVHLHIIEEIKQKTRGLPKSLPQSGQ